MEKFCISLDCPTTILQQEQAKAFFCRYDGSTLYKFIVDGTLISRALETYHDAKCQLEVTKQLAKQKETELEQESAKMKQMVTKKTLLKGSGEENQKKLEHNEKQLSWARYHEAKRRKDKLSSDMDSIDQTLKDLHRQVVQHSDKVIQTETKLNYLAQKEAEERKSVDKKTKQLDKCEASLLLEKKTLAAANQNWEKWNQSLKMVMADFQNAQNELLAAKKKKKAQKENEEAQLQSLELDIKKCSDRIRHFESEMKSIAGSRDKVEEDLKNARFREVDWSRRKADLERTKHDAVKALETKSRSRLSSSMHQLLREIAAAEFDHRPIGPLVDYIKLKPCSAGATDLLEVIFGHQLLKGFIVQSKPDRETLQRLLVSSFGKQRRPTIFFSEKQPRYSIQRKRSDLRFLIDFLTVENDSVFNLLIDKLHIERVVVAEDHVIQGLFTDGSATGLDGISKAYSYKFYRYNPPKRNSSYSSYYIPRPGPERLLEIETDVARQTHKREIERCTKEILSIEKMVNSTQASRQGMKDKISMLRQNEKTKQEQLQATVKDKAKFEAKKHCLEAENRSVADLQAAKDASMAAKSESVGRKATSGRKKDKSQSQRRQN